MLSHVFDKRKYIFRYIIYKFCSASNLALYTFTVKVLKLDVLLRLFQRLHPRMANICINGSCHISWSGVKFRAWPLICIQLTKTTWMFPKTVGFHPKSSILMGFALINHPFWVKKPYFWKHPHIWWQYNDKTIFCLTSRPTKWGHLSSDEKNPGWLGYIGWLYPVIEGLYKKPR